MKLIFHNNGSPTDVCPITPSPIRLLTSRDNIRFISSLRLEPKQLPVRLCFLFFCFTTIKRESQTLSTFLDDEGMVDFESHSQSEEEEKERRSLTPSPPDERRRAPGPWVQHHQNPLDEEQEQIILIEERARRRAAEIAKAKAHSEYRFTPLSADERLKEIAGHSLAI